MPHFPIIHPSEKPEWLDQWPTPEQISKLFPEHLRRISYPLLTQYRDLRIGWNSNIMSIRFGPHLVRWIHTPSGWVRQCSCGYKNDCCIHAYAAHCVLQEICQQEKWLPPPALPTPAARPQQPARRPAARATDDLFAENTRRLAAAHLKFTAEAILPESRSLEIEVDFHHEPDKICLRFYTRENDLRNLLSLRKIYFYCADVRYKRQAAQIWRECDRRFLLWFQGHIEKIPYALRDIKMYKCSKHDFELWREKWKEIPGRFLDRDSQEPLPSPGNTIPLRQFIRLTEQPEDKIAVEAIFQFPDGREMPYHEILRQFSKGSEMTPALRDFYKFKSVISFRQLNQFFARKTPRMPRNMITTRLAELIEGHLEIVEGDCVIQESVPVKKTTFQADAYNRQFTFQIFNDGQLQTLDAEGNAPGRQPRIRRSGNKFTIAVSRLNAAALDLQTNLLEFIHRQQGEISEFKACINANLANARAMKEFWQSIPPEIPKEASDSLKDFLDSHPVDIRTELTAVQERQFVQLDVHWKINGQEISSQDFKKIIQSSSPIFNSGGHWFEFSPEDIRILREKLQSENSSLVQSLLLTRREARKKIQQFAEDPNIELALSSRNFTDRLLRTPPEDLPQIPDSLSPVLRNYQREGVEYLADRAQCGVGSILADDMGLGKTLQILTLLQGWKEYLHRHKKGPMTALVICPASVIHVWQTQAARFCPGLRTAAAAGPAGLRQQMIADCGRTDLLISHYGLIHKDFSSLEQHEFEFIILDEAQAIKNPDAQVTRAVKLLHGRHRLALTGTPLENRALDLWSIMDFLNPGYLGSKDNFQYHFMVLNNYVELARLLAPVILRRRKNNVDLELPPRTVEVLPVTMEEKQRSLYQEVLLQTRDKTTDGGVMNLLTCLTRLRQLCCDPELLLKQPHSYGSAKLELLLEKLQELTQNGHSVLVFSQFAQMLKIIAGALEKNAIRHRIITGDTPLTERQRLVEQFEHSDSPEVFLLSLKAAGTGLTLTRADYVFLYDPWWNPAAENQAIDRTHRIGQTKPVMAYRLIVKDTVEERVLELMEQKQELFETVVEGASGDRPPARLSAADLQALLR